MSSASDWYWNYSNNYSSFDSKGLYHPSKSLIRFGMWGQPGIHDKVPASFRVQIWRDRVGRWSAPKDWASSEAVSKHISEQQIWSEISGGALTQICRWLELSMLEHRGLPAHFQEHIENMTLEDFNKTYKMYQEEDSKWDEMDALSEWRMIIHGKRSTK